MPIGCQEGSLGLLGTCTTDITTLLLNNKGRLGNLMKVKQLNDVNKWTFSHIFQIVFCSYLMYINYGSIQMEELLIAYEVQLLITAGHALIY